MYVCHVWNVPFHISSGAISYFSFYGLGVRVPMQALVDFAGFRVIAMPVLPISPSQAPIYGSHDSGKTIHTRNAKMNAIMKQVRI